ncbi:Hsp70 family protein [Nocardia sp. SYP-A9097]|uniref:Hsp70 family protein n=1 Tax=Nocardia sp. SYP-A9097 TaxID=2663237 RepID=UPI0018914BFE|nr:Hsp70 family protein [Nocardia sp. SYP-A9097]
MSQGMALGITVGSSNTVAVTTSEGQRRLHVRPSLLGAEKEVPESVLTRVGDPVDIRMRDGSAVRAADLVAAAVGRAVDDSGPAAAMVACYPAWWSQHTVEVQRTALTAAGLDGVALVPEPMAAMRWLQEVHESTHDGSMIVYDLGETGLTVSLVRTGTLSGLLGEPVRAATVAGAEFDLLITRYVLAFATGEKDFDPFDPVVEQELSTLRGLCRIAKETLSKNTATMVPVRLPGIGGIDVRLVRDEVEDLFRGPLLASADLVREAVRRAGVDIGDVDGILLTGGGAAIPLVTEVLSTEFGIPVAAATDPAHLSAHGAALLAADLLADMTATEPHPAVLELPRLKSDRVTPPSARTPDRVDADGVAAERVQLLPELPATEERSGFAHWRRVAVVGAVAVAVAALATGTLAMGTGVQSAPADSPAPQAPSTSVAALANAEAAPNTGGQAVPALHPGTTQARASAAPAPGAPASGTPAPGATTDAAAPAAPAAPAAAQDSPAPQTVPATQQQPTIQPVIVAPPVVPPLPDLGKLGIPPVPKVLPN